MLIAVAAQVGSTDSAVTVTAKVVKNAANEIDRQGKTAESSKEIDIVPGIAVIWQDGRGLLFGMA